MKKFITYILLSLGLNLISAASSAADTLYVYMKDSIVHCFPVSDIDTVFMEEAFHNVKISPSVSFSFPIQEVDKVSLSAPEALNFNTFHFNKKYNLHLPGDISCYANETKEGWMASVNSIGHYLTPSFQIKNGVKVYSQDKRVKNKKTSLNFSNPQLLTLVDSTVKQYGWKNGAYDWEPQKTFQTISIHFPSDTAKVNRIEINTEGGQPITSRDEYVSAQVTISDNGVFDGFEATAQIRGRGNTTWGNTEKKPYRIKLPTKGKPLGLKNGKNWNLINNYMDSTLMLNALAMKIGHILNIPYTNHMMPVDLYLNGEYRGNYSFTEKVGLSNNSIDVDESKGAYILEFDIYLFDELNEKSKEIYKDSSAIFHLPFCLKDPDLNELPTDKANSLFAQYKEELKALENAVAQMDSVEIHKYMDVTLFAKTFFVYDLSYNNELNWPKSIYFYKLDTLDAPFVMGPLWDFDLAFGRYSQMFDPILDNWTVVGSPVYPNGLGISMKGSGFVFFDYLRKNRAFQKAYHEVFLAFEERMPELFDFIDAFQSYADESLLQNATLWNGSGADYKRLNAKCKEWLQKRLDFVYQHMRNYDPTLPQTR